MLFTLLALDFVLCCCTVSNILLILFYSFPHISRRIMAQYGWGLMPETEFRARHELNEVPEQRQMRLDAVREQIITRPDIGMLTSLRS